MAHTSSATHFLPPPLKLLRELLHVLWLCSQRLARIHQVLFVFVYWLGTFGTADETTIITFMRLRSGIMASTTVVLSLIVRICFVISKLRRLFYLSGDRLLNRIFCMFHKTLKSCDVT